MQKAGKSCSPNMLGFQRKWRGWEERQISGFGDAQAVRIQTKMRPGGIHSGTHLLGLVWGRNVVFLLAFGLADVPSWAGNVVWTPEKWD